MVVVVVAVKSSREEEEEEEEEEQKRVQTNKNIRRKRNARARSRKRKRERERPERRVITNTHKTCILHHLHEKRRPANYVMIKTSYTPRARAPSLAHLLF